VRAIPGVTNAAYTYSLPVAGSNWNSIFIIQGRPIPERSELPSAAWTPVSTGYFDTMGIRSVEGRHFESLDGAAGQAVAIVNRTFASRFFPGGSAVGGMIKQGWPEEKGTWRQIVGVVSDVKVTGIEASPGPQVYLPVTQNGQMSGALVARTDGDPRLLARSLEGAVHEIDPNLPVYDIRSMDEVIGFGIGPQRLTMVLMIGFAGLALLMAAIGVFGVTSYSVSQRTHEIGVRMALGANSSRVLSLVLRQELLACLLGIGAGVIAAVLLSSLLRSLLFGVAPRDAVTLAGAAMVLIVVTTVACYLPARRATLVDPMSALRSE
jgi:putative ABC transport system permease protein